MSIVSYYSGTATKYFNIKVPATKPANKHLRIVLTWNSNAKTSTATNDLTDFDIGFSGQGVFYGSYSLNSNNEIINVPAQDLIANATYQVVVQNIINRIPAGEFTYFSIAWGWVVDHAN